MRDRPEHDNGRDRSLPHAKSRGFCLARKGAPGRRNRVLRTGKFQKEKNFSLIRNHLILRCPAPFSSSFSIQPQPLQRCFFCRSSSVYAQRAARSSRRYIPASRQAARASPPSTNATLSIPGSTRTRFRSRARTCGTGRRRCGP